MTDPTYDILRDLQDHIRALRPPWAKYRGKAVLKVNEYCPPNQCFVMLTSAEWPVRPLVLWVILTPRYAALCRLTLAPQMVPPIAQGLPLSDSELAAILAYHAQCTIDRDAQEKGIPAMNLLDQLDTRLTTQTGDHDDR
jgi:hypothetical protein